MTHSPPHCPSGPTSLPPLRYLIVHPAAVPPVRATSGSAGYDISASADYSIKGGSTTVVSTGLMLGFPKGTHGQLVTRSSLAARGVNVTGGLLDNDYCGEVKIILHNSSTETIGIMTRQRIAQLVVAPTVAVELTECSALKERDSERGARGFGSTGDYHLRRKIDP